jgi:hypothetical protein
MSCHVMSCHVMLCYVMSCHVMSQMILMLSPADQETSESSKRFQASAETYTVSALHCTALHCTVLLLIKLPFYISSFISCFPSLSIPFICISLSQTSLLPLLTSPQSSPHSSPLLTIAIAITITCLHTTDSHRAEGRHGLLSTSNGWRFHITAYGLPLQSSSRTRRGTLHSKYFHAYITHINGCTFAYRHISHITCQLI